MTARCGAEQVDIHQWETRDMWHTKRKKQGKGPRDVHRGEDMLKGSCQDATANQKTQRTVKKKRERRDDRAKKNYGAILSFLATLPMLLIPFSLSGTTEQALQIITLIQRGPNYVLLSEKKDKK